MADVVVHQSKEFSKIDYSEKQLRNREFVHCKFTRCDFSKSDLGGNLFEDCTFDNCNFSMVILSNTGLGNALFLNSKIQGVDFTQCNKFSFSFKFDNCVLDYSLFHGCKMRQTNFKDCLLKEVDFGDTDLQGSVFDNCDLQGCNFNNSNLEKTDFRTAFNFVIDPERNKLKKARFSADHLKGLLVKYNILVD